MWRAVPWLDHPTRLTSIFYKIIYQIMKKSEIKSHLLPLSENGKHISPILPNEIKNFLIDIDGTICCDIPNEEPERMITAKEYPNAKSIINKWYEQGHIITFFTSRLEEHREVTEKWLLDKKFKYHYLLMNKPRGGNYHWIDNHLVKATRYEGKFTDLVKREKNIEVFEE